MRESKDEDQVDGASSGGALRTTRTLLRGLAVLEVLAESRHGVGPTEIASLVQLDKGTVSRLLATLIKAGYVRRDAHSRTYALTTKILQLSQAMGQHLDLRGVARPYLRELCRDVNETVHLGIRDQFSVVYVDKVEPANQMIRMVSEVGKPMPLHSTALGKAILSQYSAAQLDEVLSGVDLFGRTSKSITDRSTLESALVRTREAGYSIDDEENLENVTCVGAPLFDAGRQVVGAISISVPTYRLGGRLDELGEKCRETASAISAEL